MVKSLPTKLVVVEPPQFWVTVKYLDQKANVEIREAFNVKGFHPKHKDDFVKDKVYRTFWSPKKTDTLQSVRSNVTSIPDRKGTEMLMGYYESRIIKMDINKAVLEAHQNERQARQVYSSSVSGSDSGKSSSSGSRSNVSSNKKRGLSTDGPTDSRPSKSRDSKKSPELTVFDYENLNEDAPVEKNIDNLHTKLVEVRRKYNDLRTQLLSLREENTDLKERNNLLSNLNLEYQVEKSNLKKNCNHVCACGQSANIQESQPFATSTPARKTRQVLNISEVDFRQAEITQDIVLETIEGEAFPDKEPGVIVEPITVTVMPAPAAVENLVPAEEENLVPAEEENVVQAEEENVTIYKNLKMPKSLYAKLKHIVEKDYGFGSRKDTMVVNDCCDALWDFDTQATHTVTGENCKGNTGKRKDGQSRDSWLVGNKLPEKDVEAITTVHKAKILQQQDTKTEDLPDGVTHDTVVSYTKRLKSSTANYLIGQKVSRAKKTAKKLEESKGQASDETED